MTLQSLLQYSAKHAPEQIAVIDRMRTMTYQELDTDSDQLAVHLQSQGIEPGDRVGIYLDKSLEAVVAIFAILKAGATYVPLDPTSPVKRIAFLIDNCQMKGIITEQKKLEKIRSELPSLPLCVVLVAHDFAGLAGGAIPVPTVHRNRLDEQDNDLAYILYTSGSTGQPKGVMISHRAALAFVDWAVGYVGLQPSDHVASHASFHFDLSIFDLFATIKAGATVVLVPPELSIFPRNLADWIAQQAITVWYSVPSVLTRLVLQGGLERYRFTRLRQILFAGEIFPITHLRQLQRLIPHAHYHNLYGPTETNVCTAYPVGLLPDNQVTPVPIGQACAGGQLLIMNEQGEPCEQGATGELWVSSATLMSGYWGLPALTAQVFASLTTQMHGKFYRTGDLVFQDQEGNLHFCGRQDTQVKSRGYRIELGEIETILHLHPVVAQAVVIPLPDDEMGNLLKAFVVTRLGETVPAGELLRFCAEHLPAYMVPRAIEFRPHLPTTATGKLDRCQMQKEGSST
ncbi:MAG: amino acid adenylation domain-containing protein [Caldilineaceae bacterium]